MYVDTAFRYGFEIWTLITLMGQKGSTGRGRCMDYTLYKTKTGHARQDKSAWPINGKLIVCLEYASIELGLYSLN